MNTFLALRSLGVGAATGLRSMSGPAAASASTRWGRWMPLLALGEMVVDKLPAVPSRTIPPALAVRIIGGGLSGGALAKAGGGNRIGGALLGIAGAVGMSYAGVAYRKAAVRYMPAFVAALLEDGVAIAIARAVVAKAR